jgi:Flp pilus assembly protein TadG
MKINTSCRNGPPADKLGHVPRTRRRSGAAAVEFALLAPLVAVIVVGMIETSRGLMVKGILSDAARKGCRTGIQPATTNAAITADVNDILTNNQINSADATITILVNGAQVDASTAQQNDQISVKVSIPADKISWGVSLFLGGGKIESETVVMMRQG